MIISSNSPTVGITDAPRRLENLRRDAVLEKTANTKLRKQLEIRSPVAVREVTLKKSGMEGNLK